MPVPGEHRILIGSESDAIRLRIENWSLRDTFSILVPGPRILNAYLFRAPLEGTVIENVTKHGCGGLNIDACRIESGQKQVSAGATTSNFCYGDFAGAYQKGTGRIYSHMGRWTTNLLLVHGSGCQTFCSSDCPVSCLDASTGIHTSGSRSAGTRKGIGYHGIQQGDGGPPIRGNSGYVSRFYPQFRDLSEALRWIQKLVSAS